MGESPFPGEPSSSGATESPTVVLAVPESAVGTRVDRFLQQSGRFPSRHQLQKLIAQGFAKVDGRTVKPSYRLRPADRRVVVEMPAPVPCLCKPQKLPLDILYHDADLIVVNKPAGMVVHPAPGHPGSTLVNALLDRFGNLSAVGGVQRPGIVHRLDKDTSGVLVAAKRDDVHISLTRQFQAHEILRFYVGMVHGSVAPPFGRIDAPVGRHPIERKKMSTRSTRARRAVTHWRVLERFSELSLLRFRLETGRTHQIRVHFSEKGHPILGDRLYGGTNLQRLGRRLPVDLAACLEGFDRLFLHAQILGFRHPSTGRFMVFCSPLPGDLLGVLACLRQQRV